MGQTLSHGVYLPNEGERNCYAGLASNWQILNTAVGAIAEKAPLVHTHTKSQITDFPAYGTTAGTICEGNDSRLSDARTPVAHTHTKSDVTDLLNSNFIPSANNAYDLGSSSNQWNNLYAKNYFYDGTAWGLDKANVYSLEQTISATSGKSWNVKNTNYTLGENTPSLNKLVGAFAVQDNDDNNAFLFNLNHYSNGEVISRWLTRFKYTNGVKSTTGTQKAAVIEMGLTNSGDRFARPGTNGDMDLGTSSFKWKTLNGINPGALSLPSSDSADYIDLSSNLSTNAEYQYTAPYDGWLCLYVTVNEFYTENAVGLYRSDTSANSHQWAKSVTAAINLYKQNKYQGSVMLPVESGKKYICYISLNANTTINNKLLFFYKNKGNV